MLEYQGSLKAFVKTEDGTYKYDYTKDGQFDGIFDESGELFSDSKLNGDLELLKRKSKYLYKVAEQETSGQLVDGKLTSPVTDKELAAMKFTIHKSLGSSDKSVGASASMYMGYRIVSAMKSWLPNKIAQYWTKTSKNNELTGTTRWFEDPSHDRGGYFDFETYTQEGVIQTINTLITNLAKTGKADLDPAQTDNLKKLLQDLVMFSILLYAGLTLAGLDDDDKDGMFKDGLGKIVMRSYMNSLQDLVTAKMLFDMAVGGSGSAQSPAFAISASWRMLKSVCDAVANTAGGDFDKASEAFSDMSGLTKELYVLGSDK